MSVNIGPTIGSAIFAGIDGPGTISVPGLKVGDVSVSISASSSQGNFQNSFERVVTVDDEIQLLRAEPLAGHTVTLLFYRAS